MHAYLKLFENEKIDFILTQFQELLVVGGNAFVTESFNTSCITQKATVH